MGGYDWYEDRELRDKYYPRNYTGEQAPQGPSSGPAEAGPYFFFLVEATDASGKIVYKKGKWFGPQSAQEMYRETAITFSNNTVSLYKYVGRNRQRTRELVISNSDFKTE